MSMLLDDLILPDLALVTTTIASPSRRVRARAMETIGGRPVFQEDTSPVRTVDLHGDETSGWVSRGDFERLLAMAGVPGAVYSCTLAGGVPMQVRFRHEDGPSVAGDAVFVSSSPSQDDPIKNLRLKLMEVAA